MFRRRRMCLQEDPSTVSLLRVCRQIYAEAASIPLRQNTFSILGLNEKKEFSYHLKSYQCRQITSLRFEINETSSGNTLRNDITQISSRLKKQGYLPSLKKLVFCILFEPELDKSARQYIENELRSIVGIVFFRMTLDIGIEQKVVE
jgi:hypothetical protein